MEQDERGGFDPQIVSLARMDVDQDNPASETSTSGGVIDGTRYRGNLAGQCSRSLRFGVMFTPISVSILSVENTGNGRGEGSERAEVSRGTWPYDRRIGSFSPCASCEEGP